MKKNIDFFAHLKGAENAVKDWPAWKLNLWPDSSLAASQNPPSKVIVRQAVISQSLKTYHRHK